MRDLLRKLLHECRLVIAYRSFRAEARGVVAMATLISIVALGVGFA